MSIVGRMRTGALYGPCVELKRTITSTLGQNSIHFVDEFFNAGNQPVPHQYLLHINFGYPLVDQGSEFCYRAERVEPVGGSEASAALFQPGQPYKQIPAPLPEHSGPTSFVGYIFPKPDRKGHATVAIVNKKLPLAVAIHLNTAQFPRVANWQHWGKHEYVCALEPATGTVEGRSRDRALKLLRTLRPGQRQLYEYTIEVVTTRDAIAALRAMNH